MSDERIPKVGDAVIFCDTKSIDHSAIITVVHGNTLNSCVNLAYISSDENKQDNWGRQMERAGSVQRVSITSAHGYYFRYPEEERKEYTEPVSK
jgi:hypothetical protein